MIKCPECGQEVSDKASTCIHCGFPLNTNKTDDIVNVRENKKTNDDDVTRIIRRNGYVSMIGGVLCPIVGWIFGGIGLAKAMSPHNLNKTNEIAELKTFNIIGIVLSTLEFAGTIFMYELL